MLQRAGVAAQLFVNKERVARLLDGFNGLIDHAFQLGARDSHLPVVGLEFGRVADLAEIRRGFHQFTSPDSSNDDLPQGAPLSFTSPPMRTAISMAACAGSMLRRMALATGRGMPLKMCRQSSASSRSLWRAFNAPINSEGTSARDLQLAHCGLPCKSM